MLPIIGALVTVAIVVPVFRYAGMGRGWSVIIAGLVGIGVAAWLRSLTDRRHHH
jgi:hypothetical protein